MNPHNQEKSNHVSNKKDVNETSFSLPSNETNHSDPNPLEKDEKNVELLHPDSIMYVQQVTGEDELQHGAPSRLISSQSHIDGDGGNNGNATERRTACHRCGNIRKNCQRCKECPYVYCLPCVKKMQEEHGQDIFDQGCPLCLDCCCCSSKSINCNRKYHCYKRCPSTKKTTRSTSVIGMSVEVEQTSNHEIISKRQKIDTESLLSHSSNEQSSKLTIDVSTAVLPNLVSPDPNNHVAQTLDTNATLSTVFSPMANDMKTGNLASTVHVQPKIRLKSNRKNNNTTERPTNVDNQHRKGNRYNVVEEETAIEFVDKDLLQRRMTEAAEAALLLKQKTEELDDALGFKTMGYVNDRQSMSDLPHTMGFSHQIDTVPRQWFLHPPPTLVLHNSVGPDLPRTNFPLQAPMQLKPLKELFRGSVMEHELFLNENNTTSHSFNTMPFNQASESYLPPVTMTNFAFGNNFTMFSSPSIRQPIGQPHIAPSILSAGVNSVSPTDEMVFALDNDTAISTSAPLPPCSALTKSLDESFQRGQRLSELHEEHHSSHPTDPPHIEEQTLPTTAVHPSILCQEDSAADAQNPDCDEIDKDCDSRLLKEDDPKYGDESEHEIHNQLLAAITSLRYCKNK